MQPLPRPLPPTQNHDPPMPQVHIGRQYLTAPEAGFDVRRAARVAVHPQYDAATSQNDIAGERQPASPHLPNS